MAQQVTVPGVDRETLRSEIQAEYEVVASSPGKGFHFTPAEHWWRRSGMTRA